MNSNNEIKNWIEETWLKIQNKMNCIIQKEVVMFPYTLNENGRFMEVVTNEQRHSWWTNGFFAGIMWIMYQNTKNPSYKTIAEKIELALDEAIMNFDGLHHDVGFMWLHSSVANYRITGNEQSRKRGLLAASILASRYNINGEFIRAWNDVDDESDRRGWAIIDSMMNIPLLYWASDMTKDPRFNYIAKKHANKVKENFVRPDGSVNHIVSFDIYTGEFIESFGGQGYEEGSSWTRGQAWAIYGFVLSYIRTKDEKYLDTAKKVAHYFISNLQDDSVPNCDFRSPAEPVYKDTTAGTIAACGLIEIAKNVTDYEKDCYLEAAIRILKTTEEKYCDWSNDKEAIVMMGTESYKQGQNIPIIYGTYFFIEALDKLRNNSILLW